MKVLSHINDQGYKRSSAAYNDGEHETLLKSIYFA